MKNVLKTVLKPIHWCIPFVLLLFIRVCPLQAAAATALTGTGTLENAGATQPGAIFLSYDVPTGTATYEGDNTFQVSSTSSGNTPKLQITTPIEKTIKLSFSVTIYTESSKITKSTAYVKLTSNGKTSTLENSKSYTIEFRKNDVIELYAAGNTSLKGPLTGTATITITNIEIPETPSTVTIFSSENGTVSVSRSGNDADLEIVETAYSGDYLPSSNGVYVSAKAANGYYFVGWEETNESCVGTGYLYAVTDTSKGYIPVADNICLRPVFLPDKLLYLNYGIKYLYLDQACTAASTCSDKIVRPTATGTVRLKDGGTSCTVPSGVTFLIPYGTDDSGSTSKVLVHDQKAISAFITVTVPETVNISVNGTLLVNAKQAATNGGSASTGNAYGQCGFLTLNGTVSINNGAKLYARGIINGTGTITAQSGSKVYQLFEIEYWRGGSVTSKIYGSIFPFTQFYFINVQCNMNYMSGCVLKGELAFYAASDIESADISLLGESSSLFTMSSNSRIHTIWDETTYKLKISIHGGVTVNNISVTITFVFLPASVKTKDKQIPMSGAYDLTVCEDGTLTLAADVKLYSGAVFRIEEGGNLVINSGYALYLYDRSDSSNTYHCQSNYRVKPHQYSAGNYEETTDGRLDIAGTVTVNGSLRVSSGAGAASSSINAISPNAKLIFGSNGSGGPINETVNDSNTGIAFDPARLALVSSDGTKYYTANGDSTVATYTQITSSGKYYGTSNPIEPLLDSKNNPVLDPNGNPIMIYAWYTSAIEYTVNGVPYKVYYTNGSTDAENEDNIKTIVNGLVAESAFTAGRTLGPITVASINNRMTASVAVTLTPMTLKAPGSDNYGINANYLIDDYIWLDTNFWFNPGDRGSLSLAAEDNLHGLEMHVVNDGTGVGGEKHYYIVRKVFSDELPDRLCLSLIYNDGNGNTYTIPYSFDFSEFTPDTSKRDLKSALDLYGKAAKNHFGEDGSESFTPQEEQQLTNWANEVAGSSLKLAGSRANEVTNPGVKITNLGASYYFDNRVGLTLYFTLCDANGRLLNDGSLYDKVGMLYTVNNVTTEILVWDNGQAAKGSNGNTWQPGGENSFTSVVLTGNEVTVNHDLKSNEYDKEVLIQPYVVLKDGTVVKGVTYKYGLKTYIKRMYGKDNNTAAWNRFLLTVWNLANSTAPATN